MLRRVRARPLSVRAAPQGTTGQAGSPADGPADLPGRTATPAGLADGHCRAAVGCRRLRGRRDRGQHRDQQGSPGAARFRGCAGVRGDGCGQGLPLHRGGRGPCPRAVLRLEAAPTIARAPGADVPSPLVVPAQARVEPPGTTAAERRARLLPGLVAAGLVALVIAGSVAARQFARGGSPAVVRLAVLPFEYLGSDPEREYLAAGLTDETSASLAQVDPAHLHVKGRRARYKGTTMTAAQIGQELGVDYLVEGSLRAEGSRLRVTATLIRTARPGARLVAILPSRVEEPAGSAAGVERRHCRSDSACGCRPQPLPASACVRPGTPEAYDAFPARRFPEKSPDRRRQCPRGRLYKQAIALDPDYALAWADLSVTYSASAINSDAPSTGGAAAGSRRGATVRSGRTRICPKRSRRAATSGGCWNGIGKGRKPGCGPPSTSTPATARRSVSSGTCCPRPGGTTKPRRRWRGRVSWSPPRSHAYALSSQVAVAGPSLRSRDRARPAGDPARPAVLDRPHHARQRAGQRR